ncbi:MAG: hypothetical protein Q4F81_11640 [Eubacteriales bacterium]|nr:hypothetical protein [Eubacteriales bacterium]
MAIQKFDADLDIISKLSDYPSEDGLETDAFKRKFDLGPNLLKDYINDILIPALDQIVDVEALLNGILDPTLTKEDKAARAREVGLALNARKMDVGRILNDAQSLGDFAISGGKEFECYFTGDNTVSVKGGRCIIQGNLIELPDDYSVELNFQSGLGGTYRNDLICMRVTRDADGNDAKSIVLIAGTEALTEPSDPAYNTGDINSGAAVRDFPLYRVKMDGVTPSLEKLFSTDRKLKITIPASGWTGSGPYTYTVKAFGLADRRRCMVYPAYGDDTDANIAMREACGCLCYTKRDGQNITFTCLEDKPETDIAVIVEVYV